MFGAGPDGRETATGVAAVAFSWDVILNKSLPASVLSMVIVIRGAESTASILLDRGVSRYLGSGAGGSSPLAALLCAGSLPSPPCGTCVACCLGSASAAARLRERNMEAMLRIAPPLIRCPASATVSVAFVAKYPSTTGDHHDRGLERYRRQMRDHISDFTFDVYPTQGYIHDTLSSAARDTTISACPPAVRPHRRRRLTTDADAEGTTADISPHLPQLLLLL